MLTLKFIQVKKHSRVNSSRRGHSFEWTSSFELNPSFCGVLLPPPNVDINTPANPTTITTLNYVDLRTPWWKARWELSKHLHRSSDWASGNLYITLVSGTSQRKDQLTDSNHEKSTETFFPCNKSLHFLQSSGTTFSSSCGQNSNRLSLEAERIDLIYTLQTSKRTQILKKRKTFSFF